jgi:hypothetical protein
VTAATGVLDIMDGTASSTSVQFDRTRLPIRLTVLWTDVSGTTNAATTVTGTSINCLRMSFAEGYLVSVKPSFTDGILKFTAVAKFPAYRKDGTACLKFDSTASASTFGALTTDFVSGATTIF